GPSVQRPILELASAGTDGGRVGLANVAQSPVGAARRFLGQEYGLALARHVIGEIPALPPIVRKHPDGVTPLRFVDLPVPAIGSPFDQPHLTLLNSKEPFQTLRAFDGINLVVGLPRRGRRVERTYSQVNGQKPTHVQPSLRGNLPTKSPGTR